MKANRLALIGIILGIAGAVLLALFVTSANETPSGTTREVLVAGDDGIPAGTSSDLAASAVVTKAIPLEIIPARALASLDAIAGQRAARPIGPGEILTTDQFSPVGPASGGVVVPEGWEAISVEARPAPGLEGYATVGSLVNIYVSSETPPEIGLDGQPDPATIISFTQLVLGRTEVLAVTRGVLTGEAAAVDANQATQAGTQVFLLRVRPQDVPTLLYSQRQGDLWFSLVNADDPPATSERFTFDELEADALTQAIQEAAAQLDQDKAEEEAAREAANTDDGPTSTATEEEAPQ